jgi:hypothetical protein
VSYRVAWREAAHIVSEPMFDPEPVIVPLLVIEFFVIVALLLMIPWLP